MGLKEKESGQCSGGESVQVGSLALEEVVRRAGGSSRAARHPHDMFFRGGAVEGTFEARVMRATAGMGSRESEAETCYKENHLHKGGGEGRTGRGVGRGGMGQRKASRCLC